MKEHQASFAGNESQNNGEGGLLDSTMKSKFADSKSGDNHGSNFKWLLVGSGLYFAQLRWHGGTLTHISDPEICRLSDPTWTKFNLNSRKKNLSLHYS